MNLNAKHNNFIFRFPKNFFPEHIQKKYEKYLDSTKMVYKSFPEFINSTIQDVSFPKVDVPITEPQETGTKVPPIWRAPLEAIRYIDRTFTIQLKHIEGFINYFAIYESILYFYSSENSEEFLPDIKVKLLNNEKQQLLDVHMGRLVYKGFPQGLNLSYSKVRNTEEHFTLELLWNDFGIDIDFDV